MWKLRDGILIERQVDFNNINSIQMRQNQMSHILFTLSNPFDELKPILCKNGSKLVMYSNYLKKKPTCFFLDLLILFKDKGIYLRENSKLVIVDVIESLNLVLVYSILNNVHYIYRINDYISEVVLIS